MMLTWILLACVAGLVCATGYLWSVRQNLLHRLADLSNRYAEQSVATARATTHHHAEVDALEGELLTWKTEAIEQQRLVALTTASLDAARRAAAQDREMWAAQARQRLEAEAARVARQAQADADLDRYRDWLLTVPMRQAFKDSGLNVTLSGDRATDVSVTGKLNDVIAHLGGLVIGKRAHPLRTVGDVVDFYAQIGRG